MDVLSLISKVPTHKSRQRACELFPSEYAVQCDLHFKRTCVNGAETSSARFQILSEQLKGTKNGLGDGMWQRR